VGKTWEIGKGIFSFFILFASWAIGIILGLISSSLLSLLGIIQRIDCGAISPNGRSISAEYSVRVSMSCWESGRSY